MFPISFKNKAYILRPFEAGDEFSISKNASNIAIWNNVRDRFPYPYTLEAALNWVAICQNQTPAKQLAIVFQNKVIGGIGFIQGSDTEIINGEIGYWLAENHWGKGVVSESIALFLHYTFQHFEAINRVFATVHQTNLASCKALLNNGFRKEGTLIEASIKNGKIINIELFAITRREFYNF